MTEEQRRNLLEEYKDVPYLDIISTQGEIRIASIFQFLGGVAQIHQFVRACAAFGCVAHFENEKLTIAPDDDSIETSSTISTYGFLSENRKLKADFMSFLTKLSTGEYKSDEIQVLN